MAEKCRLVCASENYCTWKKQACEYCIGKNRDFHDKDGSEVDDDSEVKITKHFQQKNFLPLKIFNS